jgi:SAM-dependent methyltransferase
MARCRLCRTDGLRVGLDLGPQPLCNHYRSDPAEAPFVHPMRLGQCVACGMVQLLDPAPPEEVAPRVGWIAYNEPEGHLDDLAAILADGIDPAGASVLAVSSKDDSLLARLSRLGFGTVRRLDPFADLGIDDLRAGLETLQAHLTIERARAIVKRIGRADIVLARHVWEHAHDPVVFIQAALELVKPGGRIVLEAPDCGKAMVSLDYATLWEEHILYFTPQTFARAMSLQGLRPEFLHNYPYPFENSLVAVAVPELAAPPPLPVSSDELRIGQRFMDSFPAARDRVRAAVATARQKGPVALFGAGHVACSFVSLMGVADLIDVVVDDHPRKKGLLLPGTDLAVNPSSALYERNVVLCLLTLGPDSEKKVLGNHEEFLKRGGRFASIFPASPIAFLQRGEHAR